MLYEITEIATDARVASNEGWERVLVYVHFYQTAADKQANRPWLVEDFGMDVHDSHDAVSLIRENIERHLAVVEATGRSGNHCDPNIKDEHRQPGKISQRADVAALKSHAVAEVLP